MMMTESYHPGVDYELAYRSPHRAVAATAYYSRAAPYGYYDHGRSDIRHHYGDRQISQATIQDGEANNQGEQSARRRIAVACSRCRRRKIKCSGDPGDGSGCTACKSVGPNLAQECTFIRVKSEQISSAALEMLTQGTYPGLSNPVSAPFDVHSPYGDRRTSERHHSRSRPTVPMLHTRSGFVTELDSPANASPIDPYAYSSSAIGRQDSLVGAYGSWPATCASSQPPTQSYYEPHSGYSFGSVQQYGRLPSVSAESCSSLNMGHLNSSLPSHTAQDRRLPVPNVSQYQQVPSYTQQDPTGARPLGSFSAPRIPMNGIHARNSIPWSLDTGSSGVRTGSISSFALPHGLPPATSQAMTPVSEPVMGYQFNASAASTACSDSPDPSPTSGPGLSASFDSSSGSSGSSGSSTITMLPGSFRYATTTYQETPSLTTTDRPGSSRHRPMPPMPSLYSFGASSSDINDTPTDSEGIPTSGVNTYTLPVRDARGSVDVENSPYETTTTYHPNPIQRPRPMSQNTSIENLCRQPSFEQQPLRSSTANRMSISNFSGSYQQ